MTRRSLAALLVAASATIVLAACSAGTNDDAGSGGSDYISDGKLTIGTGEPAYYPWVLDDDPESGEGFEAAVAYAVADALGFAADDVVWVRTTFDQAIAPGPKDFDLNLQQFSITEERAENVDFSSPYYETTQVVITVEGSPAASATSIADLQGLLVGDGVGDCRLEALTGLGVVVEHPRVVRRLAGADGELALGRVVGASGARVVVRAGRAGGEDDGGGCRDEERGEGASGHVGLRECAPSIADATDARAVHGGI